MMPDLARARGLPLDVVGSGASIVEVGPSSRPIRRSQGAVVSAITTELGRLSGPLAYALVAALVFGETALFFGFVLPGEIAVVVGGVLASRGRVSLPLLMPDIGCGG